MAPRTVDGGERLEHLVIAGRSRRGKVEERTLGGAIKEEMERESKD